MTFRDTVPDTEFSERFVDGMKDRMAVSYFKYGKVAKAFPKKVDAVESLRLRLDAYAETGNTEHLVDAANYCMIEYMHPAHPKAHFQATDSDGTPGRTDKRTGKPSHANNAVIGMDPTTLAMQAKYQRSGD